MNIIMNKNMKKRMDSAIDLYFFAGGNAKQDIYRTRLGVAGNGTSTLNRFFTIVGNNKQYSLDWPYAKNKISNATAEVKSISYLSNEASTFKRKFSKIKITLSSSNSGLFTDEIDMYNHTVLTSPVDVLFSRFSGVNHHRIFVHNRNGTTISVTDARDWNVTGTKLLDGNTYVSNIVYPILTKTAYKNGIAYNQAKVTGTVDGNVRVSLIAPFDITPTQTGVVLDSFQIEFFDDFDRPTAIVTGTVGDLNSTADVKMANTLIEDGAYINISGMDDFLITTPNTIAISN